MPDATSIHHCLQNHHQYCIALNINRPVVNLGCNVYVCTERTRDLIYLKFVATDFFMKIISLSAGENSGDLA